MVVVRCVVFVVGFPLLVGCLLLRVVCRWLIVDSLFFVFVVRCLFVC